jgi:MFS superfamily sulfate permease-like transporter
VLIAAMQLDEILGLTIARANNLWQELYHLYQALASGQSLDLFSTFLGLFFLSILVLVKRRYHRWPVALVGLVGITSLSLIFSWHERFSLRRLGDVAIVKAGWPQGAWPQWDYDLIVSLIVPALAIALLGSLELIVTLRAGNEEDIDLGHEIKAQGWANVVGALTSSFPASASLTRSGLLRLENAHSKNAAIIGALAMIPILFFGASFVSAIPLAVIAAVLMAGIFGLFPWKKIFRMCTLSRKTAFLLTSTFIMGVTLPFHWAVLLGVVFSLLIFLYDVQTPEILLFVPDANNVLVPYVRSQQATGIADFAGQNHMGRGSAVVVRWSGSLFFAAAHHLYQTLPHRLPQGVETVYLDLSYTHHFRYTALDALEKLNILLRGRGQTLILVGIDEAMATKFQKVATPLRWFPGPVSREIFLHTLA